MNKILISASVGIAGLVLCSNALAATDGKPLYKKASAPIEQRVEDLLSRMTLEEKIGQITQSHTGGVDNVNNIVRKHLKENVEYGSYIYYKDRPQLRNELQRAAMEQGRLGIPILFGDDVIHGYKTIYPISLAQGASFNPELVSKAAHIAAQEAYAAGVDWTFSPMIDIARDGRWGRISEGYGEDPYTTSVFCAATVKAYQGKDLSKPGNIAACLKHYVAYGASEAGRDYVPTDVPLQVLWETYLPPYEAGINAGAATVMSSFNTLNGEPTTGSRFVLTDVLRGKFGFNGFVVSDWAAIEQIINQGCAENGREASRLAFNAGCDMDMCDDLYPRYMEELVEKGQVKMEDIDESVRRILTLKFQLGLFENPYRKEDVSKSYLTKEYRKTALELAQETMVLLKNEGSVLPLANISNIALVGPLADEQDAMLGNWRGRGKADDVVSILTGVNAAFPGAQVNYARGCDFDGPSHDGFAEAVEAASKSDVVIVCLGEKAKWSGENCSRSTIALPAVQEEFLAEIRKTGKKVIVLLSSGRPLDLVRIEPLADAMVEIWQPGVEAGNAVAGILNGKYNPSGKLSVTFPYTTGQIPIYYNRRKPSRRGTQGFYQDIPVEPKYAFGWGLSYSSFEYSPVKVAGYTAGEDGKIRIPMAVSKISLSVDVKNTSSVDGKETALWFVTDPFCSIARPVKELRHFDKQMVPAGKTVTYTFDVNPLENFGFVNARGDKFLEPGEYIVSVGGQKISIILE